VILSASLTIYIKADAKKLKFWNWILVSPGFKNVNPAIMKAGLQAHDIFTRNSLFI